MELNRDHIIHSRGGRIGNGVSTPEHTSRVAEQAFKAATASGLVIHFHGGLVSQSAAEGIADRLAQQYADAGAYPIFSVWESGLFEAIRNNLKDILQDKVFQEILKKVSEWVLKEGTSSVATRGSGQAVNVGKLREEFDSWFCGKASQPPIKETAPPPHTVTKDLGLDEDDLAIKIFGEIEADSVFEATMAGLAVADQRVSPVVTRGAEIEPITVKVLVDKKTLDELFPRQVQATKGGISWVAVARFIAKVVIATLRRFANKTDHGAYTTIVEEVLRAAYLDKVGQVIWNQMKKDSGQDAFGTEDAVGDVVLQTWKRCLNAGLKAPRITLIGHSTGAIFINSWIERSAQLTPALKYDLILLAPACRSKEFVEMISRHRDRISNVRMFAMQDAVEQQDRLVPIIYPRSLLYFVSGVVEGGADVPILGMQRFVANPQIFNEDYLNTARQFLTDNKRSVWSVASEEPGGTSSSLSHSDFDNDRSTLDSVSHILKNGY